MSPALVMISETSALISRSKYLTECIKYVVDQGYFPISKDTYVNYVKMDEYEFLELMLQTCSKIFLFIDFGINLLMKEAIERAVKRDLPINYVNIPNLDIYRISSQLSGILDEVAEKTGITVNLMRGSIRRTKIVQARQIFCKRAKMITPNSLAEIGSYINRDHATVIHSIRTVENERELSELYDYYFNGGEMPRKHERLNRREYMILKRTKPVEVVPVIPEPPEPEKEVTPRRQEDNRSCIGFQAYSGYRVHSV